MVTESTTRRLLPAGHSQVDETFDCRFIDREEYCRLAISNRILVRWDDPENAIRGLFDPATGIRYAIAEGNLFKT